MTVSLKMLRAAHENLDRGAYLPSKEEIAKKCAEIRKKWNKRELKERCMYPTLSPQFDEPRHIHFGTKVREL